MKKEFLDLYMILSVLAGVIGIFYFTTPYQDKSLSYDFICYNRNLSIKIKGFLTFIFIYFLFYCVDVFFF